MKTSSNDDMSQNKNNKPSSTKDYEVGYCKPPKKNRFKPGNIANPHGRPKAAATLEDSLKKELAEKVKIKSGSKTKSVTKLQLLMMQLTNKAINGDSKSMNIIIKDFKNIDISQYLQTKTEPEESAESRLKKQEIARKITEELDRRHFKKFMETHKNDIDENPDNLKSDNN